VGELVAAEVELGEGGQVEGEARGRGADGEVGAGEKAVVGRGALGRGEKGGEGVVGEVELFEVLERVAELVVEGGCGR